MLLRLPQQTFERLWFKKGSCSVWGSSLVDADVVFGNPLAEGCKHNQTFTQAKAICDDAGGRLCTVAELEDGCTLGTGCGHNRNLIWAALPTAPVMCGSPGGCANMN